MCLNTTDLLMYVWVTFVQSCLLMLNSEKENNLALCMIVPILLHGAYNYFAGSIFIISLLIITISWIVLLKNFSRLKKSQKKKRREYEKKI